MISFKFVIFFMAIIAIVSANLGIRSPLRGEHLELAKKKLIVSLKEIATGESSSFRLVKLISATGMAGTGTWYHFKTVLNGHRGDKNCDVAIRHRPWEDINGVRVEVDCEGSPEIVRYHSSELYKDLH